jgi:hypothetical protein
MVEKFVLPPIVPITILPDALGPNDSGFIILHRTKNSGNSTR